MPAWHKCHCSTSLVTYFASMSAGLRLVLILCIARIPSWMRCWMNMYLSSMCLAFFEDADACSHTFAGRAVRVHLEIDFVGKNSPRKFLRCSASVPPVPA